MSSTSPKEHLAAIFRADQASREAEAHLLGIEDRPAVLDTLADAIDESIGMQDRRIASARLERLADLCAQVPGPLAVDLLIKILNDEDPVVRVAAGEAIEDLAYLRYAEVARAIEQALAKGLRGPAMTELPWIIAELAEPSALKLLQGFLAHPQADAVAAAVEALASLGDPEAIPAIEALLDDSRQVTLDDFEEETTATIGELAQEAIVELRGDDNR